MGKKGNIVIINVNETCLPAQAIKLSASKERSKP
jgi:hypothetical protein